MARVKAIFGDVFLYSVGAFVALMFYSIFSVGFGYIPGAIDYALPIVQFGYVDKHTGKTEAAIQHVFRDEDRVCWTVYIEKLSAADVVSYDFFADGGDTSARIPTATYLVSDDNKPLFVGDKTGGKLKTHPVGDQWHRRYCFDVAGRVPDFKPILVTGKGVHRRWPYRWDTITPTPPFVAPPIG